MDQTNYVTSNEASHMLEWFDQSFHSQSPDCGLWRVARFRNSKKMTVTTIIPKSRRYPLSVTPSATRNFDKHLINNTLVITRH